MAYFIDVDFSPSQHDRNIILQGLMTYNRQREPRLNDLLFERIAIILRDEDGTILAGAVGEIEFQMLYIDTLWTHLTHRGKGYGTQVMHAIESTAAAKGIFRAYLMTTSFQAKTFYTGLSYYEWGRNLDRPRGHTMHYLRKDALQTRPNPPRIEIKSPATASDVRLIEQPFIEQLSVPLRQQPLGIFLRDDDGELQGGIIADFWWDWCDVHLIWLRETVRGSGWGTKLMYTLDDICLDRNCAGIVLDTLSFQALQFYQLLGYDIFGTLDNRPFQHTHYFLQKIIAP